MTIEQIIIATISWALLSGIVYSLTGWTNILKCYHMWFNRKYWTNYNIVEFVSWITKAVIIVPGLIFGIQVWWLFFFTLVTSLTLIWASNKKLLPTLVGFNTLWVWISCMVLIDNLFKLYFNK
jgi:hypothetical protein